VSDFEAWLLVTACSFLGYVSLRWLVVHLYIFIRLIIYFTVYAGAARIFRTLRGRNWK
jgi:hypothetical protein